MTKENTDLPEGGESYVPDFEQAKPTPSDPGANANQEVDALRKQIEEMKANQDLMLKLFANQNQPGGAQVAGGRVRHIRSPSQGCPDRPDLRGQVLSPGY